MKGIITAILDHFTEFTWKRFRSFLLVILVMLFAFLGFDGYTSYFSMNRLSRSADLISKMQLIESSTHTRSPELEAAYVSLRTQMTDQVASKPWTARMSAPNVDFSHKLLWKFLAGLAPWALISLFTIPSVFRRKQGAASSFLGFFVIGGCFGLVAMIVPTLGWPWFNLIFVPLILMAVVLYLAVYIGMNTSKKYRKSQEVKQAGDNDPLPNP